MAVALSNLRYTGNGFVLPEDLAALLHGKVTDMHKVSAVAPIRFPDPQGAFPGISCCARVGRGPGILVMTGLASAHRQS